MVGHFSCEDCKDKKCLRTGKPCEKVERILRREGIHSVDWIRPRMSSGKRGRGVWREIPFSMLDFQEKLYNGENFR